MDEELAAAVERAYRVFAPYRLGADLEVCRCAVCMSDPDTERALVAAPLRELPAALLAEYTNSAHGYGEGRIAGELRHFLPRYLELVALGDPPCHLGLEVCLSRLGRADWRARWPAGEAVTLEAFFAALFADRLRRDAVDRRARPGGPVPVEDVEEVLVFVAEAGGDLAPLLRAWDEAPDPAASLHAAHLAAEAGAKLAAGGLGSAFWEGLPDARHLVADWLRRPETLIRLDAALAASDDPAQQAILRRGLRALGVLDAADAPAGGGRP